jgi:23S rRNA pseudouridine1911/1915/1917 synthase
LVNKPIMNADSQADAPVRLVVPQDVLKCRLDVFLARMLSDYSRSRLSAWIADGFVSVNAVSARPRTHVHPGDIVVFNPPPKAEVTLSAEPIPLDLIYEDAHLVVVDKAAGLVVHPGAGNATGTLVNGLLHHVDTLSPIGLPDRPGVVHRIDKGTSGLLVFAKTEKAHHRLAQQFSEHRVERVYRALVWDHALEDSGTIETSYGRHVRDRRKFTGKLNLGKRAVTHWRVLERLYSTAWVELRLETGRTHQIRVHMSEKGCPLLGDQMYGRKRRVDRLASLRVLGIEFGLTRQALHAASLGFVHPETEEVLRFESAIAPDIESVLTVLRAI